MSTKINIELTKELGDLLVFSMKNKDKAKQVNIGVPSPKIIRQANNFGVDLNNCNVYIDSYAVRHSLNKHGLTSVKIQDGVIPLCPFDLIFIPDLLQNGQVVAFEKDCLTIKRDGLGVYGGIVCEVRMSMRKGTRVYLKTMYNIKKKGG